MLLPLPEPASPRWAGGAQRAACASSPEPFPGCCMLTSVCLVSSLQPRGQGAGGEVLGTELQPLGEQLGLGRC